MPTAVPTPVPTHLPYAEAWVNTLYHMLFCDRVQDFAAPPATAPAPWQLALCGTQPDLRAAAAIAVDRDAEARLRLLARHVLRAHGIAATSRELLGVVVEVAIEGKGFDTLAAYADGRVRYLNHAGGVEILEPLPETEAAVRRLVEAAAAVVPQIGPWNGLRRGSPRDGRIRLNFLVSDGLYFGEGEMGAMQRDPMAGPVIDAATELLQLVTSLARRRAA